MSKLSLNLLFGLLLVITTTTGCQLQDLKKITTGPTKTVTHLVVREVNPDDLDNDARSGDQFDVYLTDTAARAEISETIAVDGLPPDTTTLYFFSDLTARQEYIFNYPNALTEAELAVLPNDHPLKQGKSIITSLSMDKRPSGKSNQPFIALALQPILTFPTDKLTTTATAPYVITDDYTDTLYGALPLERRTTIDPKTNLPSQVQLLDKVSGTSIETFAIDQYDIGTGSELANDFFTLEGWKQSLPGENHIIVEDDLN